MNAEFKHGLEGVREIIPNPKRLYEKFRRVRIEHAGKLTKGQLSERLCRHEQVLCIVNTRREAREVFEGLRGVEGAYHLSAAMCPVHRSEKIDEIKDRLITSHPCRVVSTRLIEAGVDIDFPFVYRAIGGIDSMAQAAGRCNREDKLRCPGVIFVFELEGRSPPASFRAPAEIGAEIMRKYPDDPLCLDAVEDYFRMLFWRAGGQLDSKGILSNLAENLDQCVFPFEEISRNFRMIEEEGEPVLIPYDEHGRSIIAALRGAHFPRKLLRKGQRYTVQIFRREVAGLEASGGIERVQGVYAVLTEYGLRSFYSDDVGLREDCVEGESGMFIV
jgi:CRISPR-associated endonuclease/helicase Cas3